MGKRTEVRRQIKTHTDLHFQHRFKQGTQGRNDEGKENTNAIKERRSESNYIFILTTQGSSTEEVQQITLDVLHK